MKEKIKNSTGEVIRDSALATLEFENCGGDHENYCVATRESREEFLRNQSDWRGKKDSYRGQEYWKGNFQHKKGEARQDIIFIENAFENGMNLVYVY